MEYEHEEFVCRHTFMQYCIYIYIYIIYIYICMCTHTHTCILTCTGGCCSAAILFGDVGSSGWSLEQFAAATLALPERSHGVAAGSMCERVVSLVDVLVCVDLQNPGERSEMVEISYGLHAPFGAHGHVHQYTHVCLGVEVVSATHLRDVSTCFDYRWLFLRFTVLGR